MPKYFYNPETLMYEVKKDRKHLKHLWVVLLVAALPVVVYFYIWLYISVFHFELPKTSYLKRKHAAWEAKMDIFDKQMDLYEQTLTGIEQRDDEVYRFIYGLNPIPEHVKMSGLGGTNRYEEFERLDANSALKKSVRRLDILSKRVYIRSRALDEVYEMSLNEGDMISCVPNMPPLMTSTGNFRLSSAFGLREDPVYGGAERHGGQDFAAAKGTAVYVTGDGVVEKVAYQFRGYGNEIVVDHGYGYKTRYAHLNTIEVAEGMKVTRGEKIGTVGNTGKSTGYHLHYEVIYKGDRKNPRNFMDVDMPATEYAAIINRHGSESSAGRHSSTMELLRRSKRNHE